MDRGYCQGILDPRGGAPGAFGQAEQEPAPGAERDSDPRVRRGVRGPGGVVGELFVRDGDHVKAGDMLIRLDETVTQANLAIVTKGLTERFVSVGGVPAHRGRTHRGADRHALQTRQGAGPRRR